MDQSNCKEPFPDYELERVLSPKLLDLYYRTKQRKEIAAANIQGLEECPFCDFKYVIENPDEKLFRCQNDECQAISCRSCKRPVCRINLLLLSINNGAFRIICRNLAKVIIVFNVCTFLTVHIKETEEDTRLTGRHAVEEALCKSLLFQKAFDNLRTESKGINAKLSKM